VPHDPEPQSEALRRPQRGLLRANGARLARRLAAALLAAWLLASAPAWGSVPERRRDYETRPPNEYLLIPAIASLPGIGVFAGLIMSASNLGDTGIDAAATLAESIDDSDISIQAVALQNVPTGIPGLSFDYQRANIELGNFEFYLPGRDSPDFTVPITARFQFQFVRPTLRLWERRVVVSYGLGFFRGFDLSESGNERPIAQHSAEARLLLDFTDDVIDPRTGVRIGFSTSLSAPRSSFLGEDEGTADLFGNDEDLRVRNYTFTLYRPLGERWFLAWSNQVFEAVGDVTAGEVVSGGSPPLRGYPEGRWSDRYGIFSGLELRYLFPLGVKLDMALARGVVEGIELAGFYEVGQVSPANDDRLFEDLHHSYGVGARVLFEAIIVRFDLANSDEGLQTHLTIGHAF
jgi:hypothetical protein